MERAHVLCMENIVCWKVWCFNCEVFVAKVMPDIKVQIWETFAVMCIAAGGVSQELCLIKQWKVCAKENLPPLHDSVMIGWLLNN